MWTWKARFRQAGRYNFPVGPLLIVAFLFIATACGASPQPPPTVHRVVMCSVEERLPVTQVPAPRVPVPGKPGCTVQLQISPDKALYDRGDLITVIARLNIRGDCTLNFISTHVFFDYPPIEFVNQSGEPVPLTAEGQALSSRHMAFLDMKKGGAWSAEDESSCYRLPIDQWYELSAPGTYTLTLEYVGFVEMGGTGGVTSNPITFTRR